MKIVAFLFALIGAALNMFQSVIRTPVPGSSFTGSMYDAVMTVMTNGLPDEGGTVLAILILLVLFLVPVIAAVSGLFIPFSKSAKDESKNEKERKRKRRQRIGIILCLCALANGLAAWGIYYLSSEIFVSPFLSNYIVPYAQKILFITPIIWAVFYLVAGILVLKQHQPNDETDLSYPIHGKAIVFGIRWSAETEVDCDLDASAFLLDSNDSVLNDKDDVIFYNNRVHESGMLWLTGNVREGDIQKDDRHDLEQIIVRLNDLPSEISKIVFVVTVAKGGNFGHPSSAHARLFEKEDVSEKHIKDKTLRVNPKTGEELMDLSLTDTEKLIMPDEKTTIGKTTIGKTTIGMIKAIKVVEIHRSDEGWCWQEIGEAMVGGFREVCKNCFGVNVK